MMLDKNFRQCDSLGNEGVHQVIQFVEGKLGVCFDTKLFPEPAASIIQQTLGDLLVKTRDGKQFSIEVKTEHSNKHGNFFFELWSNRKWGMQKPGWMITCKANYLAYLFLDDCKLYMIQTEKLWTWLFENGVYRRYPEKEQNKNSQFNITTGIVVPIQDVKVNLPAGAIKEWNIATSRTLIEAG